VSSDRLWALVFLVASGGCAARAVAPPSKPAPADNASATVAAVPSEAPRVPETVDSSPRPPPEAPPAEAAQPEISPAVPNVKVKNVGLHVGGGPNDAATKAPFETAIAKRFEDFQRCYAEIGKPAARGTFGIDLLVAATGGHPTTSKVRTALPGDAFRDCVALVFETVEFDPPKHGATKLSYALSFEPE